MAGRRQSAGRRRGTFDAFDLARRQATLAGKADVATMPRAADRLVEGARPDSTVGVVADHRNGGGAGEPGAGNPARRERAPGVPALPAGVCVAHGASHDVAAGARRARARAARRRRRRARGHPRGGAAGCADVDRGRSVAGVAVRAAVRTPGMRGTPGAVARSGRDAAVRVCGAGRIEERRAAGRRRVECAPARRARHEPP